MVSVSAAIDAGSIPAHIAIIMDGNGRWAKSHGLPRAEGHRRGAEAVRRIVEAASKLGVSYLTLFGFSSEKWFSEKGRKTTNLEKIGPNSASTQTEKLRLRSFILTRRGGAI